MTLDVYYNEIEPYAAQWLRNLIDAGHLPKGVVDERDIRDVTPSDLEPYAQCHFFAGIGVWAYALTKRGYPSDYPVWSGSCPCQPFSAAGAGAGFVDERHLWPHFHHLIEQRRPAVVVGEQVASKDGLGWLDLVQTDMEASGYACGAVDSCAAGYGAPHIRQRLYFVGIDNGYSARMADSVSPGLEGYVRDGTGVDERGRQHPGPDGSTSPQGSAGRMADTDVDATSQTGSISTGEQRLHSPDGSTSRERGEGSQSGATERMADTDGAVTELASREGSGSDQTERAGSCDQPDRCSELPPTGPARATNGFWADADWLFCRDGKWRPVRPGAQQMVDGSTRSMGRLRSDQIREVEKSVEDWAIRHQRDGAEGVRELWQLLSEEEVVERTDGRFDSVQEAPFLLAFLRQLTDQGWDFPICDECSSEEILRSALRTLRYDTHPDYSSRGRGLDEQQSFESANPLRLLSQILAYHTEVCWGLTRWKNVGSFPLVNGATSRVGRLRAYGNAIVAPQAEEFCQSVKEILIEMESA